MTGDRHGFSREVSLVGGGVYSGGATGQRRRHFARNRIRVGAAAEGYACQQYPDAQPQQQAGRVQHQALV